MPETQSRKKNKHIFEVKYKFSSSIPYLLDGIEDHMKTVQRFLTSFVCGNVIQQIRSNNHKLSVRLEVQHSFSYLTENAMF